MEKAIQLIKLSFMIGAIADGIVAINWLLIALGCPIHNIISGIGGSGSEFQFSMYVNFMFMTAWTGILLWGYLKPGERSWLLLLTAIMLLFSVITEPLFFSDLIKTEGSLAGMVMRLAIVLKFSISYFNYHSKLKTNLPAQL